MKILFLITSLLAFSLAYAATPEVDESRFSFRWMKQHYTIENADDQKTDPAGRFGYPAPCNYESNFSVATCYYTEVRVMRAFFKRVPQTMRSKGFSRQKIAIV